MYEELIRTVNDKCRELDVDGDHGIFREPYGVPVHIKEPVVYLRYETGGVSGGSCWDSSDPQPYYSKEVPPKFHALDIVLEELNPKITFLQYRGIERMIEDNTKTDYEYYGNCTDYAIQYIPLSKIVSYLEDLV